MTGNNEYTLPGDNPKRPVGPSRGIIYLSGCFGLCVLGFLIIQQIIVVSMTFTRLYEIYQSNTLMQVALNIPITIISIGLPFWLTMKALKQRNFILNLPLQLPKSAGATVLLVGIGLLMCMLGNFVSSYLVAFAERFNITLTSPDFTIPEGFLGNALYIVYVALLPALLEEFALRGVVMKSLSRYGDWFAIIASSLIFALMHGNWVQAPFAFIAGIGMGYAVTATGSLWTGIFIHFINNLFSSTLSIIQQSAGDTIYRTAATIGSAAIIVFGLVCLAVFLFSQEKIELCSLYRRPNYSANMYYFIFSPLMILSLGIMTVMTRFYIETPSNNLFRHILPIAFIVLWLAAAGVAVWNSYRYREKRV